MKALRIFLLIVIIIGIGLLITQNYWVPSVVDSILKYQGVPVAQETTPVTASHTSSGKPTSSSGTSSSTTGKVTPPAPTPVPTPTPVAKGTVEGQVLLGPTCPVERIPPDPACAPKGYQTTIRIQPINPSAPYTTISSDTSGNFSTSLYPGTYTFQPKGGASMPPTCQSTQVTVSANKTQTITLNCDTGIR